MIYIVFALVALVALQTLSHRSSVRSLVDEAAKDRAGWTAERKNLTAAVLARTQGEAIRLVKDRPDRPPKAHEDPIIPEGL